MDEEDKLNIRLIQHYDPFCSRIIDKSASVHVYVFQNDKNEWVKTEIGGIFFLYQRSKLPFHSFMILNRRNSHINQIEHVSSSLQLQLHCPFLLYKTPKGEIFSIWFFSPLDCERISELLGKLVNESGGPGLRVAPTSGPINPLTQSTLNPIAKDSSILGFRNQGNQPTEAVTKGLNQLMSFIRASGDSSKSNLMSDPIPMGSKNAKSQARLGTSNSATDAAPSIFDMLHKAEADFNSEVGRTSDTNKGSESTVDSELQRLRNACNLQTASTPAVPVGSYKSTGAASGSKSSQAGISKARTGSPQNHKHISVVELEQQMLQENLPAFITKTSNGSPMPRAITSTESNFTSHHPPHHHPHPARHAPHRPQSDDSSTDDRHSGLPVKTSEPRPLHHRSPNPKDKPVSRRLLSDDAGYADDVDDETYDDHSRPPRDRNAPDRNLSNLRKTRRHMRHHPPGDDVQPSNRWSNSNRDPNNLSLGSQLDLDMATPNNINEDDETLVTPDMLLGLPSAATLSALKNSTSLLVNLSSSSKSSSDERESPESPPASTMTPSCAVAEGLTKEQLREALVHLLRSDNDFLHRIHSAYLEVLAQRLSKC